MRLVIVHSHFRPGGVRRVIEMATPHLVKTLWPGGAEVLLLGGEAPDPAWLGHFRERVAPAPVRCSANPALGYQSEARVRPPKMTRQVGEQLRRELATAGADHTVVWAHNLGLGRNLVLARELTRFCARRQLRLVLHHHDWWYDNRWERWREIRAAGFRSPSAAGDTVFAATSNVRHVTINRADARILQRYLGAQAAWLPNLAWTPSRPDHRAVRRARKWMQRAVGEAAPIWLMPCRLLRRKNIAEGLLLMRWLRPEAWLVTTGAVSSAEEQAYAEALGRAATRQGWRLRLSVLAGPESGKPGVAELLAGSEVALFTSLQEGFGLPYLEAAAAGCPLIARSLPQIAPDLAHFGFEFPQYYREVFIDTRLLDWAAERRRQARFFQRWRQLLPESYRRLAREPQWLTRPVRQIPFSRLTLTGQLEILSQPPAHSWELCAPLNPNLAEWRSRSAQGLLEVTPWPARAAELTDGAVYARRFGQTLDRPVRTPARGAARRVQKELVQSKLNVRNLYPLLWSSAG